MSSRLLTLSVVVAIACCQSAGADLKVGDAAPPLHVRSWIQGESVEPHKDKTDHVYVVEFWATWCGPCLQGIPHMSAMQEHFKDKATFVGVSQEPHEVVAAFLLSGWKDRMRYTVAVDNKGGTNKAWMRAAGKNGIPCAFLVQAGKVKWIGHPLKDMNMELARLVGDNDFIRTMNEWREAEETYGMAMRAQQWDEAIKAIDKLLALQPYRQELSLQKFGILATQKKDVLAAKAWARHLTENCDNPAILNEFAWVVLTEDDFGLVRDVPMALSAAKKAVRLTDKKEAAVIDTLARAFAESGDMERAIKWQRVAIKRCDDLELRKQLREALKEYRAREKELADAS